MQAFAQAPPSKDFRQAGGICPPSGMIPPEFGSLSIVQPRFRSLAVALVPQPREYPPAPFAMEDLQRIFADVIGSGYQYQSFEFVYNNRGAQFSNGPEDSVELRPSLFQVQAKMDGPDVLTADAARERTAKIFKIAADRLGVGAFYQCVVNICAIVSAPEDDSKAFVADTLMNDREQKLARELGNEYFSGGVRFRRLRENEGEDFLSVEPYVHDFSLVWVEHQVTRAGVLMDIDYVSKLVEETFDFVEVPTMRLLSR
jgi:hypothetical protein